MSTKDRITALRVLMEKHGYYAYIIPSEDAHMSEYVSPCDERRSFITSFTGSAGTALVTKDAAYCWTDGRYFVQALQQLDSDVFKMMKIHEDPPVHDWLANNLPDNAIVAIDGMTISINAMNRFQSAVKNTDSSRNISVISLPLDVPNLVDQVWGSARPALPASTVFIHPVQYAGVTVADKIRNLRREMMEKDVSMHIVAGLDEVAWLLNLRGSDVNYNPVFWAYVTITHTNVTLYTNSTRFDDDAMNLLKENNIKISSYESIISNLANETYGPADCVWLDPNVCNYAILHCLETAAPDLTILKKQGPIPLAKAIKNHVELDGMRTSHVRDGVALVKYLCWLEHQLDEGNEPTECEGADKLDTLRSEQDKFVSLSFPTISSCGANGAIIHYKPEKKTCANITKNGIYLVDSGGQYRDGTTDVTRTMHFGDPSAWQKECFTRVLQGHIAIDLAIFPKGTTGHLLDGFARQALWSAGLDYKHGTGHGVGSFLNVHEGPHMISFRAQALGTALQPGFLTSNEPGYYEENAFGIRIESLCIVKNADVKGPPNGVPDKPFYAMEHITLCPIQTKMIEPTLLTTKELEWVNTYHKECYEKLAPHLEDDPTTLAWLKRHTTPLRLK